VSFAHNSKFKLQNANCSPSLVEGDKGGGGPDLSREARKEDCMHLSLPHESALHLRGDTENLNWTERLS